MCVTSEKIIVTNGWDRGSNIASEVSSSYSCQGNIRMYYILENVHFE